MRLKRAYASLKHSCTAQRFSQAVVYWRRSRLSRSALQILPQLSVQGLDHRCEAPAGLVQIGIAGPQGFAHGVLAGETHIRGVSVSPERVKRTGHQPPFLRTPPPASEH